MLKEIDFVDIISETLTETPTKKSSENKKPYIGFYPKEKFIKSYTSLPTGRPLLTEYELKQLLKQGIREIRISKKTIISPLAEEVIQEKQLKIVRID